MVQVNDEWSLAPRAISVAANRPFVASIRRCHRSHAELIA